MLLTRPSSSKGKGKDQVKEVVLAFPDDDAAYFFISAFTGSLTLSN